MVAPPHCSSAILKSQFPLRMEALALVSTATSQLEGEGKGQGEETPDSTEGHSLKVPCIMSIHIALPSDLIKMHTKLQRKLESIVFCWAAMCPHKHPITIQEEESDCQRKAIVPCHGLHLWPHK